MRPNGDMTPKAMNWFLKKVRELGTALESLPRIRALKAQELFEDVEPEEEQEQKVAYRAIEIHEDEELAKKTVAEIATKTINEFIQLPAYHSGDDSGLDNAWDEVCVQLQDEESIFWDIYVDTIRQFATGHIEELPKETLQAMWLLTPEADDWFDELEDLDEDEVEEPFIIPEDIAALVVDQVLKAGSDWTNESIEAFLESAY